MREKDRGVRRSGHGLHGRKRSAPNGAGRTLTGRIAAVCAIGSGWIEPDLTKETLKPQRRIQERLAEPNPGKELGKAGGEQVRVVALRLASEANSPEDLVACAQ